MRIITIILSVMIFSLFNKNKSQEQFFPSKKRVLTKEFSCYENFFPIATLDLSRVGIVDKIHVIYVSFDPDIDHYKPFPENNDIDNFSFKIMDNGLYEPTFEQSALQISKRFEEFFIEGKEQFIEEKNEDNWSLIDITDEPDWWQNDETPENSRGQPMKFVCQVDIHWVFNDDCRLYVFYDQYDRKVEYVYQRT